MITGAKRFGVFDRIENKFLEGRFFITKEGLVKKEIPIPDPDYPAVTNLIVEDVNDDSLEVKWF